MSAYRLKTKKPISPTNPEGEGGFPETPNPDETEGETGEGN